MVGNDAGDKYKAPPEDVLVPLEPFDKAFNEPEEALVQRDLRILEDQNGCLYINPDAQHIGSVQSSSDILRIYSREIQALRKVVTLLMSITTRQQELLDRDTAEGVPGDIYVKVDKYLQNASWELALVNDPRLPKTHPG
ncbi:hypothetical protein ES708_25075 [subsurface metagenome]